MIDVILNNHLGDKPVVYKGVEINNPFINYCREDKSKYQKASDAGYIDPDNDFLIGGSGGLLLNINFVFVNTHLLTEAAEHYRKHKCYTFFKPGTAGYIMWWKQETKRRKNGFVADCKLEFKDVPKYFDKDTTEQERKKLVKSLRITGDQYYFLNYSRIKRSPTAEEKQTLPSSRRNKKILDFPLFLDGQYWDFKLDELCISNNLNIVESKARRKGFTYIKAARTANLVNLYKEILVINAAYDKGFIEEEGSINSFVYKNLQWLEEQTYWRRGFLKETLDEMKLGYKLSKHGNKAFGHQSAVLGVVLRGNTSGAVGKDAIEINFEESGKNPNLDEALGVTLSAAEDGGEKIGIIRVFGTGGTKDTNWIQFSNCFYNPAKYEMVCLENVWDENKRNTVCGFFYPQTWGYFPYVQDGNSLLLEAFVHDYERKEEAKKNLKSSEYAVFVGQRANSPQEAFINTLDNIFSSVALTEHLTYIQNNEDLKFYKDGWVDYFKGELRFLTNDDLIQQGHKKREYVEDVPFDIRKDITGAVRMYHAPYTMGEARPPKDSYIVLYDPYGIDKNVKDVILKNSLACIYVIGLRNAAFPFHEDKLCCAYVGRMNTMEESDLLAIRIADSYGAKIVAELNRGTMLQTAKKFNRKDVLARDISGMLDNYDTVLKDTYGVVIGSGQEKLDLLGTMADWLYQHTSIDEDGKPTYLFQKITDIPFIKELTMYNSVNNFDRVSCYLVGIKHLKYHAMKNYKKHTNRVETEKSKNKLRSLLFGR